MITLNSNIARVGGLALLGLLAIGAAAAPARARELTQPAPQPTIEDVMREKARQVYEESLGQPALSSRTEAAAKGEIRGVNAPVTAGTLRCLPTCDTTDGRFLAIAGSGFDTLSPPELNLSIGVPAGAASFEVGVFDGDGSEYNADGITYYWDSGATALFEYALYADPDANGTGTIPVDLAPGSPTILSNDMPDNDWINFTVNTGSEAASPSGNFFYVLKVRLAVPSLVTLNAFKVRTTAVLSGMTLDPVARPFSYIAAWSGFDDLAVVYPDFPSATPTTYDGSFNFFFDVPVGQDELTVWDGDFDHGKYNLTEQDTDDPDTPFLFIPPWATLDTHPEGIAFGGLGTGSPPDDENINGYFGEYILREPSVTYHLVAPDGQDFNNPNPSGNQEWEQFKISTAPFNPLLMDAHTSSLPPGTYRLEIQGIDMLNLNALLLPFRLLCVEQNGAACIPLRPYLVGDTVFRDSDGDGLQDPGEPGIPGVVLELRDSYGTLLGTATTNADGNYSFGVDKAAYEVSVAASNFNSGAPLAGHESSTGGDSATTTVTNDNDLDLDFGYSGNGTLSGTLWEDRDGDNVQDAGEPILANVTVKLVGSDSSVVATTTTDANGDYSFSGLGPDSYTVEIDSSTLPAGLAPSYDADGTATPNEATVAVAPGAGVGNVDFGYRGTASVGDRVWNDTDGDGLQDSGEAGLNGVMVRLLDSGGNTVATATTSGNGNYSFTNLAAGAYTVSVDSATLPAGYSPTADADGIATPNRAAVTVTAGGSFPNLDFGYRSSAQISLGDRVWNDADGDGLQDSGEAGLNGVSVQLLNSGGTVIATQTTSGSGNYSFTNLAPGTYSIRIVTSTLPAGATPTFDLDGTATPNIVTGTTSASRADVDFGYRLPATCTAGYFKDHFNTASFSNNDGTLSWAGSWVESDTAGSGVNNGNVTVGTPVSGYMIFRDSPDTGTQPSAARQANLSGFTSATLTVNFHIRGVEADDAAVIEISKNGGTSYTVLETLTGYTGTYISARTFDISSYIASNTRIRFRIATNYGGSDDFFKIDWLKIDAACTSAPQTGSVGDRVWKDLDGDGVQDSGEPGLSGVTVQLLNSGGTVIATQTTNSSGNYLFSGLAAGTYKVQVVSSTLPSGSTKTYDLDGTGTANIATFTLTAGQNRTDVDFGYRPATACSAGYFKDHFNTASFSNNDGTLSWTGSWAESDTAGSGVSSGNVTVGTPVSGYMIFRDSPDTGTQPSAARQANLSGFTSATLTVSFHIRGVETDDAAVIEVSNNGGSTYTVLETLTGYTGTYTSSRTFNISSYIASNTKIRFRIKSNYGGSDDFFKIDWVKVDAACQ